MLPTLNTYTIHTPLFTSQIDNYMSQLYFIFWWVNFMLDTQKGSSPHGYAMGFKIIKSSRFEKQIPIVVVNITRNVSIVHQMFSLDLQWIRWSHWTRPSKEPMDSPVHWMGINELHPHFVIMKTNILMCK